jgi:hypothetical protein
MANGVAQNAPEMHLARRLAHLGQVEWREFREDVLEQLPHAWFSPADTRLRVPLSAFPILFLSFVCGSVKPMRAV